MEIRIAHPSEYERLGELAANAYLAVPGMDRHADHIDELRDVANRAQTNTILVAVLDDEPAGIVTYVPDPASPMAEFDDPDAVGVRSLAVDPSFQRRGVGRALMDACVDQARREGKQRVVLHTTEELVSAHALYRTMGFDRDPVLDFDNDGVTLTAYVFDLGQPT